MKRIEKILQEKNIQFYSEDIPTGGGILPCISIGNFNSKETFKILKEEGGSFAVATMYKFSVTKSIEGLDIDTLPFYINNFISNNKFCAKCGSLLGDNLVEKDNRNYCSPKCSQIEIATKEDIRNLFDKMEVPTTAKEVDILQGIFEGHNYALRIEGTYVSMIDTSEGLEVVLEDYSLKDSLLDAMNWYEELIEENSEDMVLIQNQKTIENLLSRFEL